MNDLLVSVVIPTYKRSDTLDRAIKSVLAQTNSAIEVIVVDDNNPGAEGRERTELKMLEFSNNPKVKYVKHEKNKNESAARNTGFRNTMVPISLSLMMTMNSSLVKLKHKKSG